MMGDVFFDERPVSWKVLLPHNTNAKVLTVELNEGSLKGIARTWSNVDSFSPSINLIKNKKYDVIIVGSINSDNSISIIKISSLLSDNGILVCTGFTNCCVNKKQLSAYKFFNTSTFSSLPLHSPRIFFNIKSNKTRNKGLSFHSPGSLKARIAIIGAKIISNAGFKFHLKRGALLICQKKAQYSGEKLIDKLSLLIKKNIEDFVIYAGSDSPRRKITLLAIVKSAPDVVVKIADTLQGKQAIIQETSALEAIHLTNLAMHVPKLIARDTEWKGYLIQVQSCISSNSVKQIRKLTEKHYSFLSKLSAIGFSKKKIEDTSQYQLLSETVASADSSTFSNSLNIILSIFQNDTFKQKNTFCHRTHGDFAPWNITITKNKFSIVDWEDSEAEGIILWDIFHFIYRTASLVGPWPGASRLLNKIKSASDYLCKNNNYPEFDYNVVLMMWLLKETLLHPSVFIKECIEYVAKKK